MQFHVWGKCSTGVLVQTPPPSTEAAQMCANCFGDMMDPDAALDSPTHIISLFLLVWRMNVYDEYMQKNQMTVLLSSRKLGPDF
jgi:hypothetical protein